MSAIKIQYHLAESIFSSCKLSHTLQTFRLGKNCMSLLNRSNIGKNPSYNCTSIQFIVIRQKQDQHQNHRVKHTVVTHFGIQQPRTCNSCQWMVSCAIRCKSGLLSLEKNPSPFSVTRSFVFLYSVENQVSVTYMHALPAHIPI